MTDQSNSSILIKFTVIPLCNHPEGLKSLCACGENMACPICGYGHGVMPCSCDRVRQATEKYKERFKEIMAVCMDRLFCARFQIDTSPFAALSHVNWVIGCLEGTVENLQKYCISTPKEGKDETL